MAKTLLDKEQVHVILAVTFGNILEWYEIYSFAYLVPQLSILFFQFSKTLSNWISAFLIFGIGLIFRPVGAIIFGRMGDLIGRKNAFVASILIMTVPTFLMGCLPTYAQWGWYAPFFLVLLRIIQGIPAAGEVPGTICFLYENTHTHNKRFITSWTGVGNQIGAILGVVISVIITQFMSEKFLMSWGWRISFWSGGLFGLFGIYLRRTLHETPLFEKLKKKHKLDTETTLELIINHKKRIALGTAFGVVNASTFYLIATYVPTFFDESIGLSFYGNAIVSLSILILTTVFLPFFGKVGDKFNNKLIFILSTILIIILLLPLSIAILHKNLILILIIGLVYIIPVTCISALLPYLLAHLFPTAIRFTGVGLAVNLADGLIGGFTPAISLFLLQVMRNNTAFVWYILLCALVSLVSYFFIKKRF
ncbi:MAG: MFS transporter [Chlamydiales bacterium]